MKGILPIYQEDFLLEWSAFLSSLDHQSNLVTVALIYAENSKSKKISNEVEEENKLGLDKTLQKLKIN